MNDTLIIIALTLLGGYVLGSIPFGLVITRLAGLGDIRTIGSGNIGATNVLRTGRKDLALATLVLDAGKAGLAALIAKAVFGAPAYGLIAAGAAFFGHLYPVWLNFTGGKGVATFFGSWLAVAWPLGAIAALIWLGMAKVYKYSSLAALTAAAALPLIALLPLPFTPDGAVYLALFMAALIFWRHRANIQRLLAGSEPKIGQKSDPASSDTAHNTGPELGQISGPESGQAPGPESGDTPGGTPTHSPAPPTP